MEYTSDVNLSKVFFLLWTRKRSEGAGGKADYHHRQRPRVCSLVSSSPLLLFLKEQIQSCCCKHPAKEYSLTTVLPVSRERRPDQNWIGLDCHKRFCQRVGSFVKLKTIIHHYTKLWRSSGLSGTSSNTGNVSGKAFRSKKSLGQTGQRAEEAGGLPLQKTIPVMSDSPVTPTPQTMVPKLGLVQGPRVTLDLQAAIRQQDRSMQNGNSVPSLTASQVRFCEEALKQITQKIKISGARSPISLEFDRLQSENTNYRNRHLPSAALSGVNKSKNRYTDVLAYDNTRVVLDTRSMEPGSSDYINASFIQGGGNADLPKYIATQGPLPCTVKDLWSMVLQQQCPVIVMLTCIVVGNQKKCAHYFPLDTEQTQAYGHITVTNKSTTMNQCSIARRILEVQDIKSAEPPITVVHYEYLDWPDYSTPPSTRAVRELVRALYSIPPQAGPFVVHCSAGIGRTGTFCTIDHTLRRILVGDLTAINIENTVRQFRLQRDGMVQTQKQYRFCYEAVLDELNDYVSAQQQH